MGRTIAEIMAANKSNQTPVATNQVWSPPPPPKPSKKLAPPPTPSVEPEPVTKTKKRGHRTRVYQTNAERQAAYRARKQQT